MRWVWTWSAPTQIMMLQLFTQSPLQRGQYFVDRDPTHFPTILNFLRVCCTLGHQCAPYNCCCCPPVHTKSQRAGSDFQLPWRQPRLQVPPRGQGRGRLLWPCQANRSCGHVPGRSLAVLTSVVTDHSMVPLVFSRTRVQARLCSQLHALAGVLCLCMVNHSVGEQGGLLRSGGIQVEATARVGCAYADSAAGTQYSVSTVHRALVPRAETTWLYEGEPKAMHECHASHTAALQLMQLPRRSLLAPRSLLRHG